MRNSVLAVLAALACLFCFTATAREAAPAAADPALEQRMMNVAAELRCLVCQNQTIADSNAGLAVDLRNQIREQLKDGKSERDVLDYMVERYGEFVLYRPPFKTKTALLWLGPFLLFLGGLWLLYRVLRQRRAASSAPLSAADQARARALLGEPVE